MSKQLPETSFEALDSVQQTWGELDRQILHALKLSGRRGLTCEQLEDRLQRPHQSVSGNLAHLQHPPRQMVIATKWRRKNRSGRTARVYVLVAEYDPDLHTGREPDELPLRDQQRELF